MATANPYADVMKFWSDNMKAPQMPNFDVSSTLASGRRTAEACTAAGQVVAESCQAIARRQAELTRNQVEKVLKGTKEMMVNGSPELNPTKQVELAKSVVESNLNNIREVCELVTKSGFEVFDLMNKCASQTLSDIAPTPKKKASAA